MRVISENVLLQKHKGTALCNEMESYILILLTEGTARVIFEVFQPMWSG